MKLPTTLLLLASFFKWNANAQELIQDRDFQQGFYVRDRFSGLYQAPIRCDTTVPTPVWNIAEWGSQSSVLNITPVTLSSGMCQWSDNNKDFRFGPIGAEPYQLYFGVNSQNEYNNVYRQQGEPWPHLLIEQRFSPPFDFPGQGPGCPPLSVLDSLVFKIDAQLLYNQTILNAGYDPTLHAGQFLIFFTVQNLNSSSLGYGKYVWLGIPLYDDRTAMVSGGMSYDIATQTLINNISYSAVANVSMHSGAWVHSEVDILPYAKAALDTAWANGFLNESTNFADYKIGGMNMGWELPGMNIATVGVRGISLFAFTPSTGIKQTENNSIQSVNLYPNPATDNFVIKTKSTENQTFQIHDVYGKLVLKGNMNSETSIDTSIDTSILIEGVYYVSVSTNEEVVTKSIIIMK